MSSNKSTMMKKSGGSDRLLTSLILLQTSLFCYSQEILVHPTNITVCINEEPPPLFTCETIGGISGWWINGTPFTSLPLDTQRELEENKNITRDVESSTVLTLTIPIRVKYNGTTVQCRVFSEGSLGDQSNNATLLILFQDIVQKYSWSSASDVLSIPLVCYAPFSLDVTETSSDVTYYYTVTEEEIVFSTDVLSDNSITVISTKPCYLYNFTSNHQRQIIGYIINARAVNKPVIELLTNNTCLAIFNSLESDENGCRYTVITITEDYIISKPSLPHEPFQLWANEEFSFNVSITNDASGSAFTTIHFTTFDIQSIEVSTNMAGLIQVTGQFIINSTARGMFIVLESEDGSPDVFRALLRQDSGPLLTSTIDNVPPSTYQVLVYDLEEDLLPNRNVAYEFKKIFMIVTESADGKSSNILKHARIHLEGSSVILWCEFNNGIKGASCVLVYKRIGNKTLEYNEYYQETTNFPVALTVNELEFHMFAVFGKNSSKFEHTPNTVEVWMKPNTIRATPIPSMSGCCHETDMDSCNCKITAVYIAGGMVGGTCFIIISLLIAVVVSLIAKRSSRQKEVKVTTNTNTAYGVVSGRNAPVPNYEVIDPPQDSTKL